MTPGDTERLLCLAVVLAMLAWWAVCDAARRDRETTARLERLRDGGILK